MESKDEASDTDSGIILQSGEWLRKPAAWAPRPDSLRPQPQGWPGRGAQGLGWGQGGRPRTGLGVGVLEAREFPFLEGAGLRV